VSEIAALITAVTGLLVALGGGVVWLWARVEKRFASVEAKLDECERREARHLKTAAAHLTVIELLWQEVKRRTRGANDVLERAEKLLDDLKKDDHQ